MDLKYMADLYNPEFIRPLILGFKLLNGCYILFYDSNLSKFEKFWKFAVIVPSVIFFYVTMTVYIIKLISETKAVLDLVLFAPFYIFVIQSIFRGINIIWKKSELIKIIDDLGSMWRTTDLTEIQVNKKNATLKKFDVFQKAFFISSITTTVLMTFAPLIETLLRRYVFQQDSELLLPYHGHYPFDPTKTYFRYITVYIFQSYSMFICVFAYAGSEFLMLAICSHLVIELTLLREDLVNLRPTRDVKNNLEIEENNEMDIKKIVKRHQKLIILSNQLDDIYNKINFLEVLFVTIITSLYAFAATVSSGGIFMVIYFIATMAVFFPLFILCYFSELLANESTGIAEAAYENLWYEGGRDHQKSIYFIIVGSQKARCLTSLKYAPINLATFSKLLSTAWSYFTIIYGMYEEAQ